MSNMCKCLNVCSVAEVQFSYSGGVLQPGCASIQGSVALARQQKGEDADVHGVAAAVGSVDLFQCWEL